MHHCNPNHVIESYGLYPTDPNLIICVEYVDRVSSVRFRGLTQVLILLQVIAKVAMVQHAFMMFISLYTGVCDNSVRYT